MRLSVLYKCRRLQWDFPSCILQTLTLRFSYLYRCRPLQQGFPSCAGSDAYSEVFRLVQVQTFRVGVSVLYRCRPVQWHSCVFERSYLGPHYGYPHLECLCTVHSPTWPLVYHKLTHDCFLPYPHRFLFRGYTNLATDTVFNFITNIYRGKHSDCKQSF
jgi:hypothetical protein